MSGGWERPELELVGEVRYLTSREAMDAEAERLLSGGGDLVAGLDAEWPVTRTAGAAQPRIALLQVSREGGGKH